MNFLPLIAATGLPVLFATLKVAVIAVTGFILARRGLLHDTALRDLSALVVQVTVPCLVFSTAAQGLGALGAPEAVVLIVSAPIIIGLGCLVGAAVHRIGRFETGAFKPLVLTTGFANSSYLPIAVATSVMPALAAHYPGVDPHTIAQTSIVCISLYLVLYSPLFWGFAFWWMSGEAGGNLKWTHLLTPPVLGLLAGYIVGLTPLHRALTPPTAPLHFLLLGVQDIGGLTIPLANLILGGMLFMARELRASGDRLPLMTAPGIVSALIGKMVIVPGIVFAILALTRSAWNHGDIVGMVVAILFLQSTTPPATNLAVMGGTVSEARTGLATAEIMMVQYPAAVITIPVWLTLFYAVLAMK